MGSNLENGLIYQLNIHGYGFQYALINQIKSLSNTKNFPWYFEVSEFPVELNNSVVHIDFILRNSFSPFFIVAECKRANPAFSNWIFLKTPFTSIKSDGREQVVREEIKYNDKLFRNPFTLLSTIGHRKDIYSLAFEVKTPNKGDSSQGRVLNEAITQVLRGKNGLINFFANQLIKDNKFPLGNNSELTYSAFFPIIFTTANLFVSNHDLKTTDLSSGNIENLSDNITNANWIFYQYNQSPNISHKYIDYAKNISLSDALFYEFSRTIAIVNVNGIEDFFLNFNRFGDIDWDYL